MASALSHLSTYDQAAIPNAAGMSFGIVVSDWNADITHALYEGCYQTLLKHGATADMLHTIQVPGAFELPQGARMLAQAKTVDAVICLGCVIKGETQHDEYINRAVASGIMNLGVMSGKPHIFGVLTTNNHQQAADRAGGKHGNKGVEAAVAAIRMTALRHTLKSEKPSIGFGKPYKSAEE